MRTFLKNSFQSWRRIKNALSGIPAGFDRRRKRFEGRLRAGENHQVFKLFAKPVSKNFWNPGEKKGELPETTPWIQSSNDVYALVEVMLNDKDKSGNLFPRKAYALLRSPYPGQLERVVCGGVVSDTSNIYVVDAYWESDLKLDADSVPTPDAFSWVLKAYSRSKRFRTNFAERHGLLIQDSATVWRSGSAIFWASDVPGERDKCDIHYYCHHTLGHEGIFMHGKDLRKPGIQRFMHAMSVKLNDEPLDKSKDDISAFIHGCFPELVKIQSRGKDPYDYRMPDNIFAKMMFVTKRQILRGAQKFVNLADSLNWGRVGKAVLITGGIAAFFALLSKRLLAKVIAVGATAQASIMTKALSKSARTTKNLLFNETDSFLLKKACVADLLCDEGSVEVNGVSTYRLSKRFIAHMKPIDAALLSGAFEIQAWSKEEERKFGLGQILSTLGGPPGTVFEYRNYDNRTWLCAIQPNGLDVYHAPEAGYAQCGRVIQCGAIKLNGLLQTFSRIGT